MRLRPRIYVRAMCRVGIHPGRGQAVVQIGLLGSDSLITLKAILLEPRLDIGRRELSRFRPALILSNRANHARNPITQ
jgi:hypothetical protein